MQSQSGKKSACFVSCADTWLGIYAARAVLKCGAYSKVVAAVFDKNSEHARQLEREGAHLCEWDVKNVDSIARGMSGCESCVIVPVPSMSLKNETDNVISAAEKANVQEAALWSVIETHIDLSGGGPTEKGREIAKMLKAVEERFQSSKVQNKVTLRLSLTIQALFFLSDVIQDKAILPMATGNGKYAPVNLKDVGQATAKLLSKSFPPEARGQTYTLTGSELITSQKLAEDASKALNAKIQYKDMSVNEFADLLEKLVQAGEMTEFEKNVLIYRSHCIREGKGSVMTEDLKKLLGATPTTIEKFFEENSSAFRPGKARKSDRWFLQGL